MKLTLQIKLLPTKEQFVSLKNTLIEANTACNEISEIAFTKKIFGKRFLHKESYYKIRSSFKLSSQATVQCIVKVANAYAIDKRVQREFRPLGAISYDARILTYKPNNIVSIWSIGGRIKVPFVCHNAKYIPYIKGEADLVFKKGKFYLFQTVEVPEEDVKDIESFIGVDFGITDIATTSDGTNFGGNELNKVRDKYFKVRKNLQSKGTKSAKRLLKRLSGKEKRFATITNHTISKQIVLKAKSQNKGVAIEDLTFIRKRMKVRKPQMRKQHSWSFAQLRSFITYKTLLHGVPLAIVPPAYTSKTCNDCFCIGNRSGKHFECNHCGNISDADINAAKNIATWGRTIVNRPEGKSVMYCIMPHLISKAPIAFAYG